MRIPIKVLRELAKKYDLSHAILFVYHPEDNMHHIVTWGRTIVDCGQAADFGNKLKEALGWPDELLSEQPARVKRLQKRIKDLEVELATEKD